MGASKQRRRIQYLEDVLILGNSAVMNYKKFCKTQLHVFSRKYNRLIALIKSLVQLVLIPDFITFLGTGFFLFKDGMYNGLSFNDRIINLANGIINELSESELLEKTKHDNMYLYNWSIRIAQMLKDKMNGNDNDNLRNQLIKELYRLKQERCEFLENIKKIGKEQYILTLNKSKEAALAHYYEFISVDHDEILVDIMSKYIDRDFKEKYPYVYEYDIVKKVIDMHRSLTDTDFLTYKKMSDKIDTIKYKLEILYIDDADVTKKHNIMYSCIQQQESFQNYLIWKNCGRTECDIDSDYCQKIAKNRLYDIMEKFNKLILQDIRLRADFWSLKNYPHERQQSKSTRRKAWKSTASLREVKDVEYSDIDFDYSIF
jgi:hypothetical protein